jgi:hypothetical protein
MTYALNNQKPAPGVGDSAIRMNEALGVYLDNALIGVSPEDTHAYDLGVDALLKAYSALVADDVAALRATRAELNKFNTTVRPVQSKAPRKQEVPLEDMALVA